MSETRTRTDVLAKLVLFLSTTESRSKVYRVCQYGAKSARWVLLQSWQLQAQHHQATSTPCSRDADRNGNTNVATVGASAPSPCTDGKQVDVHEEGPQTRRRQAIIAALARVELLFGDARKVYRLLQFLEMTDMFRNVNEELRVVRVLRRLRVACFFLFYALENWMLFQLRVRGLPARDPRVKALKRGLNGFWCLSILLAFPLDHLMGRNGALSTLKKLLDLPVAYVAFSDQRVSDGLFGALGLASGNIGVYLRWVEVMRKLQATQSGAINAVGSDVA